MADTIHLEISAVVARAVWACCFDDDDLACQLVEVGATNAVAHLFQIILGDELAPEREALIHELLGMARAAVTQEREEFATRLAAYLALDASRRGPGHPGRRGGWRGEALREDPGRGDEVIADIPF